MAGLTLHSMKEIRVIVSGENRPFVTELLDKVEATGYTIIGNISGKGITVCVKPTSCSANKRAWS